MTIETGIENAGVYIDTLDDTYPASGDDLVEGDNHIRGIKNCLLNSFPAITGAVTSTHTELNLLDGATVTTTEINYNDITTLGTVQASKTVTADSNAYVTFDVTSAERQLRFSSTAPHLSYFYGATSGDVGLYDSTNTRGVWNYSESANTFTITPPIVASGGVTGALTGNADTATAFAASGTFNATGGDVTGSASSANGNYTVNLQIATDAVTMTELQTTAGTDTSASVGATSAWSIADGWYAVKGDGTSSDFQYQVYVQSAWRTVRTIPDDTTGGADQVLLISGSSRIYNNTTTRTIYYRKIAG